MKGEKRVLRRREEPTNDAKAKLLLCGRPQTRAAAIRLHKKVESARFLYEQRVSKSDVKIYFVALFTRHFAIAG
jgi:hypothetical protein